MPPASRYPTVASGQAVLPTAAALGFPDLSAVLVPNGATSASVALSLSGVAPANQVFVTDYTNAVPVADLNRQYTVLVPKVDANGNETSGILMPELAVPLATYAGWNLRAPGHAAGENCQFTGTTIPFSIDPALKAPTDPRTTLSQRYSGRADYFADFDAATDALVSSRTFYNGGRNQLQGGRKEPLHHAHFDAVSRGGAHAHVNGRVVPHLPMTSWSQDRLYGVIIACDWCWL